MLRPATLPAALLEVLADLERSGITKAHRTGVGPDDLPWVELDVGGHRVRYRIRAASRLTTKDVGRWILHAHEGGVSRQVELFSNVHSRIAEDPSPRELLFSERIGRSVGEELRRAGVEYVDGGGNAYLKGPTLVVWIEGRPARPVKGLPRTVGTAIARVLYVVLRDADLHELTQREIAARAGVSIGSVSHALRLLESRGALRATARKAFEVGDRRRAFELFSEAWTARLRPKLLVGRFRMLASEGVDALPDALRAGRRAWQLGGEAGAALRTRHLSPAEAALHLPRKEVADAIRALKLAHDPDGPITFFETLDDEASATRQEDGLLVAHDSLLYAELLVRPEERRLETAQILLEGWVAGGGG